MKKFKIAFLFVIAIIFVLIPFPATDINIRLNFEGDAFGSYTLYYSTTTGGFSEEQCVSAEIEPGTNRITFRLDSSLEEELTGLRLDFPGGENVISVKNVTVSSAGIVQKQIESCDFFSTDNISAQNHISEIVCVESRDRAYIVISGDDPYIILSDDICYAIKDSFSHLLLTRICISFFFFVFYFLYKKKLFSSK